MTDNRELGVAGNRATPRLALGLSFPNLGQ